MLAVLVGSNFPADQAEQVDKSMSVHHLFAIFEPAEVVE